MRFEVLIKLKVFKLSFAALCIMAASATAESRVRYCVGCAGAASGDHAVAWDGRAYQIHPYPCEARWQRAEAMGRFEGLEGEISPGSEIFAGIAAGEMPSGLLTAPGGALWFWLAFYAVAACLSGGLGCLFAVLLGRSAVAGFLLGSILPAVGMVLVPVLPLRRSVTCTEENPSEN